MSVKVRSCLPSTIQVHKMIHKKEIHQTLPSDDFLHFIFQVLYVKLFSIPGILWTFSFLHYIVHGNHNSSCEDYSSYLEIFFRLIDSINILRGFFIFLIFVCKKTVWVKVKLCLSLKSSENQFLKGVTSKKTVCSKLSESMSMSPA